ncbi:MAG: capsule assembly Wzi family protein [candidate division Zixibacteria bacterium]|nr:capsule assembly Wzi family protein [candidate division Zixibacteria bacterium]
MTRRETLRKTKVGLIVLFLIFVLNTMVANPSQTIPLNDEAYHWVYEYIDYLYSRGFLDGLHYGTKPYTVQEVAKAVKLAQDKIDNQEIASNWVDEYVVKKLEEEFAEDLQSEETKFNYEINFSENLTGESKEKPTYREKLGIGAGLKLNPHFSAYTRYIIDETLAKDSSYTGKVWRGFAGDASQSYISFDLSNVSFYFGRDRLSWGESRFSSLILSEDAFPVDMFRLEGGWGILKFSSFAGVLSPMEIKDSTGTTHINRYLSGHRLSFAPCSWLQVGFSETALYGGENRNIELYYAIPFIWYHGVQLNEQKDDNTFFSSDLNFRPLHNLIFYGEFLIDDIQIEKKEKTDKEPDELGFMGGMNLTNILLPGTEVNLEYQKITNWTYNQAQPYNRYLHKNKTIGSSLGTDSDMLRASLSGWIMEGLRFGLSYSFGRQGEGRINAPWTQAWLGTEGEYKEKFPSGIVEKKKISSAYLEYDYRNRLRFRLFGKYTDISNQDNIENKNEIYKEVGVLFFCLLEGSK